jgi:acylphosphatase
LQKPVEDTHSAKRYLVRGRVQGVGFRNFAKLVAGQLGVRGYARNLADGSVEVYAIGTPAQLSDFNALLYKGPPWAEVRGVEEQDAPVEAHQSFVIL